MNEHATLNASVFSQLRQDILTGRLRPGERLRAETLRQRYDVGGSPVREALMRLETEGFVVLEENKGFRVADASVAHLQDLSRTRIEIEALALKWSIAKGGVDWESSIVASMHRLASVPKHLDAAGHEHNADWLRYHREFHAALVAACDSAVLLGIRNRLFDQAERYVALSITAGGEVRDDVAEHQALMEAVLSRDTELALALNRRHLERTTKKLLAALEAGANL
ncbi:GntR family transcriptional regulator [Devosia lacusdianchii]|uniref:GntR family transcriptional regulator n=1 Tax=Devosia lacusdianchii TaxID=2917991 RepID=UPI001F05881B|nr:FCD domain-containing protein [Devosia sp. JXJ CY 41]